MPKRPRPGCAYTLCPNLAEPGSPYCKEHQRKAERSRGTSTERGYSYRWRVSSRQFLSRHPLCSECLKEGITKVADCVDHIIPHNGNLKLFWDEHNWQSLCSSHHTQKTARGE